jgi:hypothetical protein
MYNRAKRDFDVNVGSTSHVVGPGTYELLNCTEKPRLGAKKKSKAPFGTLSERKTLEYVGQGILGPGAGYYKVPSQFQAISGGKIPFQNGPRLVDPRPVDDNPPPGAYFNMVDWSGSKSKLVPKKHAKIGVVFKPAIDPPSIPAQGQAYGYEYMGPAKIKKQQPPKRDNTLGPAYYSPKKSTINTETACKWSKRSDKRDINHNPQFQLNSFTPGPQHYDTTDEINEQQEETRPLQTAPRFTGQKPDAPPSTKYNLTRFGDDINENAISSSFVSTADRFVFKSNGVPFPGTYDHKSDIVTKKSFRVHDSHIHAPFTSSSARFKSKKVAQRESHLGPATYDVTSQSLAVQSIRDAIMKKTMKGGFGSNALRTGSFDKPRSHTVDVLPGPGQYQIRTEITPHKASDSSFGTSCFTSMSSRMKNPRKAQEAVPSPWEYDIKHHSIEAKLPTRNKRRNITRAFNGTITRKKAEQISNISKAGADSPGPAAYTMPDTDGDNVYISQGKRFVQSQNDAPHPQTYSLIDDRFGALEKTVKTFNVTLGRGGDAGGKEGDARPSKKKPSERQVLDKNSLLVASKC